MIATAVRSWAGSVLACVAFLAAWVAMHAVMNDRLRWVLPNMLDISFAFGAVFAVVAAVLYVPAFAILQAAIGRRPHPVLAVACGVLLAPAAALAFAMTFRETESPQTIWAQLAYWSSRGPEVLVGLLPVLAAGAVFGLLWSRQPLALASR